MSLRRRIWVTRLQLVDGVLIEWFIQAVRRHVNLIFGNALCNEELLNTLPASLRQRLVVLLRTAFIRIGGDRKFRVRVIHQILCESICKSGQSVFLTFQQSDRLVSFFWIVRGKEYAIQQYCRNRLNAA